MEIPEDGRVRVGFKIPATPENMWALMQEATYQERKRCMDVVKGEMPIDDGSEFFGGKISACENIMEAIEAGE